MALIFVDQITPTGVQDGSNQTFTLPQAPNPASSLQVWLNGTLQQQSVDYTLSGATYTYLFAVPEPAAAQLVSYRYDGTGVAPSGFLPVSELLYHAARLAQITLLPGNIPSPDQSNDFLMAFNRMIGSWNVCRNNIFSLEQDTYTLTPNQQKYTLGPGGNFNAPRPQRIERAKLLLQTTPTTLYKELNLLTDNQWADKPVQQVVTIPNDFYNDGNWPVATCWLYPIPDQAYPIILYCWQVLSKAAALTTILNYPDGYELAIVTNLACKIAPMFGKKVSPDVRADAINSLAAIQGFNAPTPRLRTEKGLTGKGGFYNYLTGRIES